VREINAPVVYSVAVTGSEADGYTITNTRVPEKTFVKYRPRRQRQHRRMLFPAISSM